MVEQKKKRDFKFCFFLHQISCTLFLNSLVWTQKCSCYSSNRRVYQWFITSHGDSLSKERNIPRLQNRLLQCVLTAPVVSAYLSAVSSWVEDTLWQKQQKKYYRLIWTHMQRFISENDPTHLFGDSSYLPAAVLFYRPASQRSSQRCGGWPGAQQSHFGDATYQ